LLIDVIHLDFLESRKLPLTQSSLLTLDSTGL
jgi:hypothetical protein